MYLSQANFGTSLPGTDQDLLFDLLDRYLHLLLKNGQICGGFVRAAKHGQYVAYAYAVRPDAISERFHSVYGREALAEIREVFQREPIWRLIDDTAPSSFPTFEESPWLYLFTSSDDGASPVCCGQTGDRMPAYLIPVSDDDRARLCSWSREYERMDGVWFASGELETAVHEQLASPNSGLARQGRDLARIVSDALHKPVYYYIVRHYGRGPEEYLRRCPGCGGPWYRGASPDEPKGEFWEFPFRCDPCRLVSNWAYAHDELDQAQIGEFVPPA